MEYWKDKSVLITGSTGFVGIRLLDRLDGLCKEIFTTGGRSSVDLTLRENCKNLIYKHRPDVIIHLAAVCGGIGANQAEPGKFFFDNAAMGINLIEEARLAGTKKFICLGTVCCYPKFTPVPFKESDLWNNYPEETNAPYGLAKKMLLVQLQAYHQQYGMESCYLLPANMYGPGDSFDHKKSHVIPALIKKIDEAQQGNRNTIQTWGTGKATREFLYVDDCVDAIIHLGARVSVPMPINVGTGNEISIAEVAGKIARIMRWEGSFVWDSTKPDGQPRRCLDTAIARASGWEAKTSLADGLQKTIDWYRSNEQV